MSVFIKTRPIYKNTLVFPVWVFDKHWHIYDTTDFLYNKKLVKKHHTKCDKLLSDKTDIRFALLGFSFLTMKNICPVCAELEKILLQKRGYLDKQGNILRRKI